MKYLFAIALSVFLIAPAMAQNIPPQQVQVKLYQQCMVTADQNFAQQQKAFCSCTSQKIANQVSSQEIDGLAARVGQGASQADIGNAVMADPRFIQIVSYCFSTALGQQGQANVPVAPNLPSNPSGLVGKPFSKGN